MRRLASWLVFASLVGSPLAGAFGESGPFLGLDLGVSDPINGNYRAHVKTGFVVSPYGGYMFNDLIGLQVQGHGLGQPADDDDRGFKNEEDWTGILGITAGPRFVLPTWDVPIFEAMELYATAQGGFFGGLSGRLDDETGGGVSIGGGIDFYVTKNVALSAFGRWNRLFMDPNPHFLPDDTVVQSPGEQGPKDAEYATVGIGLKYDFREPPAPPAPPACPACVCPECPVSRKIVLRNVYFDFDQASIRPDAVPALTEAADILKGEEGEFSLVLEGHTDSYGGEAYNQGLSERRAEAVRKWLTENGVPAERIRAVGFGESRPAADNKTPSGRALNRRVEPKLEE